MAGLRVGLSDWKKEVSYILYKSKMALFLPFKRQKVQSTFIPQRWDHHAVSKWAPMAQ
jgi:hypothetical protein